MLGASSNSQITILYFTTFSVCREGFMCNLGVGRRISSFLFFYFLLFEHHKRVKKIDYINEGSYKI